MSPPLRRSGRRTNVGTGNATFVSTDGGFGITVSGNRTVSARYGQYGSRLTSFQPNNSSNEISPLANHGLLRYSRRLTTIVPLHALASPALTIGTLQLPCGLWTCGVRCAGCGCSPPCTMVDAKVSFPLPPLLSSISHQ